MKEFVEQFENKIFPTMKGKDGEGLNKFKKMVEEKKKEVQKRKQKRLLYEENLKNEENLKKGDEKKGEV